MIRVVLRLVVRKSTRTVSRFRSDMSIERSMPSRVTIASGTRAAKSHLKWRAGAGGFRGRESQKDLFKRDTTQG